MTPFQILFDLDVRIINGVGLIKRFANFFFHHYKYSVIKKNKELRLGSQNKKCYICALGPSLKNINFDKLKGDSIVVNRFFKIGKKNPNFIPTYYIMIDDQFADPKLAVDLIEALDTYINKGTKFILNSRLFGCEVLKGYNSDQIYFISSFKGCFNPDKDYNVSKILPIFENVVGAAITCAIDFNYKNILLLGCDFNSFASTTRNHCYQDTKTERWYRMSFELFCYAFAARTHDNIQKYALKKGVSITNSTKGSLIDAYPLIIEESLYYE